MQRLLVFRKRRFTAKQLESKGKPMLYADWPKKAPSAKTVLFYMHLDGHSSIAGWHNARMVATILHKG